MGHRLYGLTAVGLAVSLLGLAPAAPVKDGLAPLLTSGATSSSTSSSTASAESTPTSYPGGTWSPPEPTYGIDVEFGRKVRMDDGVALVVDVSYPTDPATGSRAAGPFPVLLNQDMYAGGLAATLNPPDSYGDYFVQRGYIYVHVHDRGTGGSEGAFDPGFGDRVGRDGVSMAFWSSDPANVAGADGRVGLHGCSALGVVQLATLAALGQMQASDEDAYVPGPTDGAPGYARASDESPILASIPACVGVSVYHEQYTDNGVPSFINLLSAAQPAAQPVLIGLNTQDLSSNFQQSLYTLDMMTGGDPGYHRDYWKERDFIHRAGEIAHTGVPVLTWVGLQEGGFIGTQPLYAALQNAASGRPVHAAMLPACPDSGPQPNCQEISPRYHTLMGDWGHGGGMDAGIELQWFETWMKGELTGLESADEPIHIHELQSAASRRWLNSASYPMTSDYTQRYLDVGGALSGTAASAHGSEKLLWGLGPPVTFTVTEAQDEDLTLFGPAAVRLWVESSNTNVQLFAELRDVAPDGTATPITHGSILASRRRTDPSKSWETTDGFPVRPHLTLDVDEFVEPNTPVQLDVPLQPITWRLPAGHRLQLSIGPNPGVKCSPSGALFAPPAGCILSVPLIESLVGGVYTIHHGPSYPSVLNAALVPSDSLATVPSGATPTSGGTALPLDWGSD